MRRATQQCGAAVGTVNAEARREAGWRVHNQAKRRLGRGGGLIGGPVGVTRGSMAGAGVW